MVMVGRDQQVQMMLMIDDDGCLLAE